MLSEGWVFWEPPELTVLYKTLEGNSATSQSFSGWVKSGKILFSSDVSRSLQIYICKRPPLIHLTKWSYIFRSRICFWILEGFLSLKIWLPETSYFKRCSHIDVLHFFMFDVKLPPSVCFIMKQDYLSLSICSSHSLFSLDKSST